MLEIIADRTKVIYEREEKGKVRNLLSEFTEISLLKSFSNSYELNLELFKEQFCEKSLLFNLELLTAEDQKMVLNCIEKDFDGQFVLCEKFDCPVLTFNFSVINLVDTVKSVVPRKQLEIEAQILSEFKGKSKVTESDYVLAYDQFDSDGEGFRLLKTGKCWADVVGLDQEIKLLKKTIYSRLDDKSVYERMGVKLSTGMLLHGPSGCGKSMLIECVATDGKYNVLQLNNNLSKYFGESERRLRNVFKEARRMEPSILVIEDIDVFCSSREENDVHERLTSTLLNEMDGIQENDVFVIGCCQDIEVLDDALIRHGRLGTHIKIDYPNAEERELMIKHIAPLQYHDKLSYSNSRNFGEIQNFYREVVIQEFIDCQKQDFSNANTPPLLKD